MLKNFGKGAIWFAVYFALQNIFSTVFALVHLFQTVNFMEILEDADKMMDAVLNSVLATVMPALIVSALAMMIIYAIHRKVIKEPLHLKSVEWQKIIFFTGVACIINVFCNLLIGALASMLPESWMNSLGESVGMVTTGELWILLLGTGLLVPIMEEITFRYGIHGYLAKSNVVVAYIASSIIFGVMHGNPVQIIYATILGLLLAVVYQKTGNLWYPITIHAVSNSASVLTMVFETEIAYAATFLGIGAALVLLSVFCFPNVKQMFKKQQ